MWLRLRATAALRHWLLVRLEEADQRFDELWRVACHDYPLIGRREAAFLRWRFGQHPLSKSWLVAMVPRETDSRIDGYAVLEAQGDTVCIRDVFSANAQLPALLDLVLIQARRDGFRTVSCVTLKDACLSAVLIARGFTLREQNQTFVLSASNANLAAHPELAETAAWYVTTADEDD